MDDLAQVYLGGMAIWTLTTTFMCWCRADKILLRFALMSPAWPVLLLLGLTDNWPKRRPKYVAPPPFDQLLVDAQREVDAMLPETPPIAPPRPTDWQLEQARGNRNAWPAAQAAQATQLANAARAMGMHQGHTNAYWAAQGQRASRNPLNLVCISCGALDRYCACTAAASRGN